MRTFKAYIKEVNDHDTVTAVVEKGFEKVREVKFQLYGMKASKEDDVGQMGVRDILSDLVLGQEVDVYAHGEKLSKKARNLATIVLDGLDINQWLSQMQPSPQFSL